MKLLINTLLLSLLLISCSKQIDQTVDAFPALDPLRTDTMAGNWKLLLLSTAFDIPVNSPTGPNDPAYRQELDEIISLQKNMDEEQLRQIRYWQAGAVLRWNEILRSLVAERNLPPYQNDDGSYPFPNPANPLAYPIFPFANPPYAARAYAYVAAAQYDALVAAYAYKPLYRRLAPYTADPAIKRLIPAQQGVYAYPSEDAVVLGATVEMLRFLFPADEAFIQKKAAEHRAYRLLAGANTRSDMVAGEALGRAVAQKFVARARTDKAGAAVGNAALWAQLETDCIASGNTPWKSLETPKRPPMLPLFGKVKPWLMDSAEMRSLRPPAPPVVGSPLFNQELDELKNIQKNLSREQMRIAHFWADGVGTYTPPGHWNSIAAEALVPLRHSEVRMARNFALLNMAMMDAAINCWDTKYTYFNPRPSQVDPLFKTITGVPNFPAYTSGHSTFSGAAATILSHLVPARAAQMEAMAAEASISRMYGGIHYRKDCEEGLKCGKRVGEFAIRKARSDGAD